MRGSYQTFLTADVNGGIWWRVTDAVKLGAGYVPVKDPRQGVALRATSNLVRVAERTLLGALANAYPKITKPQRLTREGEDFVEARDFLNWLSQYVSLTQADFPFPSDLALAVRDALDRLPKLDSAAFEPMTDFLAGYFNRPLKTLPEAMRQRVKQAVAFSSWDSLTAKQRRVAAEQWDLQNDPDRREENEWWFRLYCEKNELNRQIVELQEMSVKTPLERESRERQIRQISDALALLVDREAKGYLGEISATDKAQKFAGTIKEEKDCLAWLKKEVARAKEGKSKSDFEVEAKQHFKISSRGFVRIWRNAIDATGRTDLTKPGRKSKRRIDTPK